jgi:hypothetical protein
VRAWLDKAPLESQSVGRTSISPTASLYSASWLPSSVILRLRAEVFARAPASLRSEAAANHMKAICSSRICFDGPPLQIASNVCLSFFALNYSLPFQWCYSASWWALSISSRARLMLSFTKSCYLYNRICRKCMRSLSC